MNDVPDFIKRALESGESSTTEVPYEGDSIEARLERIDSLLENILDVLATRSKAKPQEVRELIVAVRYGNKIEIIRWVRAITGMALKEAKDLVEEVI